MTIIYSHKPLKDRVPADFYPTPIELCRAAIQLKTVNYYNCLDVGAGDGIWGQAFCENHKFGYSQLTGIDIREDAKGKQTGFYDNWIIQDFLKHNDKYDFIFGNPPFRFANEIVEHSLNLLNKDGLLLLLLRSAFSESKLRYDKFFFCGLNPMFEYQSVRRISFTGNKKSDNTAYSIFIWQKGYKGETIKRWLDWDYEKEKTND